MRDFLMIQDALLHKLGDIEPERDAKFHELINKFDSIK